MSLAKDLYFLLRGLLWSCRATFPAMSHGRGKRLCRCALPCEISIDLNAMLPWTFKNSICKARQSLIWIHSILAVAFPTKVSTTSHRLGRGGLLLLVKNCGLHFGNAGDNRVFDGGRSSPCWNFRPLFRVSTFSPDSSTHKGCHVGCHGWVPLLGDLPGCHEWLPAISLEKTKSRLCYLGSMQAQFWQSPFFPGMLSSVSPFCSLAFNACICGFP